MYLPQNSWDTPLSRFATRFGWLCACGLAKHVAAQECNSVTCAVTHAHWSHAEATKKINRKFASCILRRASDVCGAKSVFAPACVNPWTRQFATPHAWCTLCAYVGQELVNSMQHRGFHLRASCGFLSGGGAEFGEGGEGSFPWTLLLCTPFIVHSIQSL